LPAHRQWRQVPVVPARSSGAVSIRFLMTAHAIQPRHTLAGGATNDVGKVTVTIITLLRIVRRRVTVDTTRRRQHRIDLLLRGEPVSRGSAGSQDFASTGTRRLK